MKKFIVVLVAVIGLGISANAQNVVIQTNEIDKSKTVDDCAYRISGICTSEDLGGVEVETQDAGGYYYYLKFTNYNSFTVSVIYEYVTRETKKTGTIILKPKETKKTENSYYDASDFKLIARKLKN